MFGFSSHVAKIVNCLQIAALAVTINACNGASTAESKPESGTTGNQGAVQQDAKVDKPAKPSDATTPDKPSPPETKPKLSDAELVAKMSWSPVIANGGFNGKMFTGFSQGTTFQVALVVFANGELPADLEKSLSPEDIERLYKSADYEKKASELKPKLSLKLDSAFFSVMELSEADVGPGPIRVFFATSLKAGSTSVDASLDDKTYKVATTITAYTQQQINDGKARYTTAVAGATPSPACVTCHGAQGGANHSPTYMAQFTDAAILSTIKTGMNSDDGYKTQITHKMTFTNAAQEAGIVAYLRSLPPMP